MATWYYANSKTRDKSGPHPEAEVRAKFIAGEIGPRTLVWHDGLPDWIPAGEAFASLQAPSGAEGRIPLPGGLRGWMTFVGIMTILAFLPASLLLYGLPMLLAGVAVLGARSALDRIPAVSPDMVPFLTKLKTFFSCMGWMYIIGLFFTVLLLLAYAAAFLFMLSSSRMTAYPFCTPP